MSGYAVYFGSFLSLGPLAAQPESVKNRFNKTDITSLNKSDGSLSPACYTYLRWCARIGGAPIKDTPIQTHFCQRWEQMINWKHAGPTFYSKSNK